MAEFSYIHIPFCAKKCKYCSFVSFVNKNLIKDYLNALFFEIDKKYDGTKQKTLYFGGGTPSMLPLAGVKKIVDKFNFIKNPEITFEINPEDASEKYLSSLLDIGINRLSIGVQTFCDDILKEIGRRHDGKKAIDTIKAAKRLGFKNISIDLIYGLPNQTIDIFKNDLKMAAKLEVEHISTYGLKIEEKTYYMKHPPKNAADEDMQALMYEGAIEILKDYLHYEISNFAFNENFISKHNLNYWDVLPYNAFGVSASGFSGKTRYKNTVSLKKYIENPFLYEEEIELQEKDILEETIFLGFRKMKGLDKLKINQRFNIDFDKKYNFVLEKYLKTGHIEKTETGYKLTKEGILISNYILCDFLC